MGIATKTDLVKVFENILHSLRRFSVSFLNKKLNRNGSTINGTIPERQRTVVSGRLARTRSRCDKIYSVGNVNRWHVDATSLMSYQSEIIRIAKCCTEKYVYAMMMCQVIVTFSFPLSLQWNRWSTGVMSRSRASCSALDSPSSSPCRCSRLSASSPISRSWRSLEPSHSESTKRLCRPFRRHPRDILSSECDHICSISSANVSFFFREFLNIDLTLSPEKIQQVAGVAVTHVNAYIAELRRLFLVEDFVDSLKFALLLWLMTYIGAIFNGMTVVILGELPYDPETMFSTRSRESLLINF